MGRGELALRVDQGLDIKRKRGFKGCRFAGIGGGAGRGWSGGKGGELIPQPVGGTVKGIGYVLISARLGVANEICICVRKRFPAGSCGFNAMLLFYWTSLEISTCRDCVSILTVHLRFLG